ncbi:MAG: transcriptional repressor [Bdellovibrionaceae bacterium]|nr:transcriptional repressor [Pseudobdellovibrionaceae bacterium]
MANVYKGFHEQEQYVSTVDSLPSLIRGEQNPKEELVSRERLDGAGVKRIIREMSLKVTKQRMAILEALNMGQAHVTAQEVYEIVNEKYPEIGFATVYRFLRKLTENNYVTEVRMGGLPARYELTPKSHHDHLTCVYCSKIVEFENAEIERLQEETAKKNNFILTSHVLELYGVCNSPECRKQHQEDQGY